MHTHCRYECTPSVLFLKKNAEATKCSYCTSLVEFSVTGFCFVLFFFHFIFVSFSLELHTCWAERLVARKVIKCAFSKWFFYTVANPGDCYLRRMWWTAGSSATPGCGFLPMYARHLERGSFLRPGQTVFPWLTAAYCTTGLVSCGIGCFLHWSTLLSDDQMVFLWSYLFCVSLHVFNQNVISVLSVLLAM